MSEQKPEGATCLLATATSIALVLVFTVIAASAYLRLDQAGLGCADWPACYGARLAASGAAGHEDVSAIFHSRPAEVASVSAACHMTTSK